MQSHQNEDNPTEINESGTNWDEVSLARLLGFHESIQPQNQVEPSEQRTSDFEVGESETEVSTQNAIATHELFDDPQAGKTLPTFYSNPFAKFGAVGLVMLVVFGAGATVLNSIMSGKPKVAPTIANQKFDKPKVEIADNANSQATETGKLKAELALGSQAEKIKSVERSKSPKVTVTQRKIQTRNDFNRRTPPRIASREIRPAPISYTPRPITQNSRYFPTRVASVPRPQPPATRAIRPEAPISSRKEAVDPMEEWAKISRLGSYGGIELASNTVSNTASKTIDTTVNEQPTPPTIIPRATLVSAVSGQSSETDNSFEIEPLYAEEAVVINGEPVQQLTVGASAPGKIVTPLIWGKRSTNNTSQKSPTPTEGEKFLVQLVEPLTTESGFVSLPKGSQIIAQVANIQKSGLVELQATQVVIDGKEYLLPPGAISVRGNSGQPLIASKWGDKGGEIAAHDAETFVVNSLAKIGKVLNQPKEEQISTSSGFGGVTTFSSTRRGDANILGAVLEGGFEPLTQQIQRRNQQALSEIQQREEVWYVGAGTDVQVFVNQSFQFENFER